MDFDPDRLFLPYHPIRNQLRQKIRTLEIDGNQAVKTFFSGLQDVLPDKRRDAGIVHENIQSAEAIFDFTDDVIMGQQMGTLQMGKAALSFATTFIPEVKIFDLPYLFANRRHLNRVLDGPLGEKILNEVFPKYGLIGLFYQDDGARSVYCMDPVRKPADLKGKKIRVMTSDVMIDAINAMGGVATPMAWPEVYTGLEQKTIDGAENSPVLLFTSKHWEVSKVYSMKEQFWLVSALFTSKKYWDTLPADIQQRIRKAADVAKWYCRYIYLEDENVAFDKLQGVDVKVVRNVDVGAFKTAVQPVWQRDVKKYPYADEWIKQIQATPAD